MERIKQKKDLEEKTIKEGLIVLSQKKLNALRKKINNGKEIYREVDSYLDVRKIMKKERINVERFDEIYKELIKKYWEIREKQEIY